MSSVRKCIGLCSVQIDGYFQTEFYCAALNRAREYGWGLLTYACNSEMYTSRRYFPAEAKVFDIIDYDRIDGLIILSETIKDQKTLENLINNAKAHDVFVVCVDRAMKGCYNIQFNFIPAFEAIVRHVVEKHGCRVINVMGGLRGNEFSDDRIECCRRVMKENGLELDEDRILYGDFWSVPTLRAMESFFASGMSMPDAFVCCNDTMAMAVCASLKDHGYAVPSDVIVTGFDGVLDEQFHIPRITTAKQGNAAAAEKAVDAIIANMDGKLCDNFFIVDHRISYTHSCGFKPIDYRESTGRIQVLFDMIQESANVDTVISEMNEAISCSSTIEEVSREIYSHALSYKELYYCLCINENFMNISTDYSSFISPEEEPDSRSLILCESFRGFDRPPCRADKPLMLESAIEEFGALLYWPIHFSDMNIGYGVCTILPEVHLSNDNGVMRNFPKFTRNINHALEIANSQSVMKKVIKELQRLYVRDHTGLFNRRGFYNEIDRSINKV
ncbi:MAG: substrate-binding domain-containing protein, partial [Oscillospiraceae bacterium]|nr:substrate-binding domain-containing protein [Oscillospiraceae bacterium]